ncbi:hypothetical protein F3Y22_tig00110621pilonHSYRG00236 [Hibiscus syriacus]|uniref:GAT domain-containing protein n=1 Tax=Hibiscus syriacus TaxID=106335 RepID=A0A6A3A1C4_HIBSY|nr:hypothetical protein F3Y22_tig00110621pilonHSYRG00236 [Hibiscus syriacus]
MHLVMSSRDEKAVSQAIELNEQLQKVLIRHNALLSGKTTVSSRPTSTEIPNHFDHEEEEEEEPEQLFRRMQKGKACARPEDEEYSREKPHLGLFGSNILGEEERLNRPLFPPLPSEPSYENSADPSTVAIPPPPAKHVEREKYLKEKKVDGSAVAGHMRGLSLHSRNVSSSRSGSLDFSD